MTLINIRYRYLPSAFNPTRLLTKILMLLFYVIFHSSAWAVWVDVEGRAAIAQQDTVAARLAAMQDAMRQASLQAGAEVRSESGLSDNVIVDDRVRLISDARVEDVVVQDEWIDEENALYIVRIRARVTAQRSANAVRSKKHAYRKKITVTQFHVIDRRQIYDLPDVERLMARELVLRLQKEAGMYVFDASDYLLPDSAEPFVKLGYTMEQVVVQLAGRYGAQFVLGGVIQEYGVTRHLLGVEMRHLQLDVYILDGISGTLIARRNFNGSVTQSEPLRMQVTSPAMNEKFFASPIGEETDRILNDIAHWADRALANLPFMARVIQVSGNQVYVDVGSASSIQTGDLLMSYRQSENPLFNASGGQFLGQLEAPATTIRVKQVQPLFFVGEVKSQQQLLQAGDVVRISNP